MSDGTRPRPASGSFFYAWWLVLQERLQMTQDHYRLNVHYSTAAGPSVRLRTRGEMLLPLAMGRPSADQGRTRGDAIRGVMIGAPIAAVLWIPIVWVATHLL